MEQDFLLPAPETEEPRKTEAVHALWMGLPREGHMRGNGQETKAGSGRMKAGFVLQGREGSLSMWAVLWV